MTTHACVRVWQDKTTGAFLFEWKTTAAAEQAVGPRGGARSGDIGGGSDEDEVVRGGDEGRHTVTMGWRRGR